MELTHFSLFSGIAGFDLAADWAGFRTIGQVEKNPYRQRVLRKYWPDVPLWEDIRDVTGKSIREIREWQAKNPRWGITLTRDKEGNKVLTVLDNTTSTGHMEQSGKIKTKQGGDRKKNRLLIEAGEDVADTYIMRKERNQPEDREGGRLEQDHQDATERSEPQREIHPVTLVTGGFPCQPFSAAGQRRGEADDRFLWPEMLRVIKLIKPTWVVAENVAGLTSMGQQFGKPEVVSKNIVRGEEADYFTSLFTLQERMLLRGFQKDLESEGYETDIYIIPACAISAPHRRDRVWIVARNTKSNRSDTVRGVWEGEDTNTRGICQDVGYSELDGRERRYTKTGGEVREGKEGRVCEPERAGDVAHPQQGEVGDRRVAGRTPDEGRGATKAGREALRPREEAPQPGDPRQGGEALADAESGRPREQEARNRRQSAKGRGQDASNPEGIGIQGRGTAGQQEPEIYAGEGLLGCHGERDGAVQWESEPDVGRVAYGVPSRVDRLSALGDAIVPQVAYQILRAIAIIETEEEMLSG